MGIFDDLISIDENGRVKLNKWIEWKHVSYGLKHCSICLAIDKCWFDYNIKPNFPHHKNCHCKLKFINKPLPNKTAFAQCDIKKFTDYIFGDKYAWNGKRDLFYKLGFNKKDAYFLQQEYIKQAVENYCESKYTLGKLDGNGQRINIDIKFNKNEKNIVFKSGWMVLPNGLIKNNTPLGG